MVKIGLLWIGFQLDWVGFQLDWIRSGMRLLFGFGCSDLRFGIGIGLGLDWDWVGSVVRLFGCSARFALAVSVLHFAVLEI